MNKIELLNQQFEGKSPEEVLQYFLTEYKGKIALSSSLSIEDQLLTDLIVKIDPSTRIFTLDTGRLFPETYSLIDKTNMKYNIQLEVLFPKHEDVQKMVKEEGINLFYAGILTAENAAVTSARWNHFAELFRVWMYGSVDYDESNLSHAKTCKW